MIPYLKNGDYSPGLSYALSAVSSVVAKDADVGGGFQTFYESVKVG